METVTNYTTPVRGFQGIALLMYLFKAQYSVRSLQFAVA
jgi:hypothetical protein